MPKLLDNNALEKSAQEVKTYVDNKIADLSDIAVLIKGDKGDTGEKGDKGDTGADGPKGEKGDGILLLNGLTGLWAGTQNEYNALDEIDDTVFYLIKPDPIYVTFNSDEPRTITPVYNNAGVTLQYSLDKKTWVNIASKGVTPSAKTIYMRGQATGTKRLFTSDLSANTWSFSGTNTNKLRITGNLNYLLCDNFGDTVAPTTLANNCYCNMFYDCTSLVTAPVLPATTLANSCYSYMFCGCTSLVNAPELPAPTLMQYCYSGMFQGCTSLSSAKIHATTSTTGAFSNMFTNVKNTGTLTCKEELTPALLPTPSGWTRINF